MLPKGKNFVVKNRSLLSISVIERKKNKKNSLPKNREGGKKFTHNAF
ncbi:hypothetical protein Dester_1317 [Desulfurobacterium thermolithotrophum DSM 11699]|uniref:Uncharacterized protein n=1 Tax=Desulfurobacterium thermolithotrophum (strain DSM 11699 / BSA) TaxID=868864 RepID=F0S174_DESTD|nr:hypothetical protein Dester_1317 [Desulfurobacterium thermolithotrophum DSM 11699]